MTEFWRCRQKCAGVMHFCGLGYSRPLGQTSDNFTDLETLTFEPNFRRYVRDSFAPVAVVIDLWKEQVEPSTALAVPVMVINDLEPEWHGGVALRVEKEGKAVWEEARELEVDGFRAGTVGFQVRFPDGPAECELIASIRGKNNERVRSCRRLSVRVPPARRPVQATGAGR